jgi:hypothetical protein
MVSSGIDVISVVFLCQEPEVRKYSTPAIKKYLTSSMIDYTVTKDGVRIGN